MTIQELRDNIYRAKCFADEAVSLADSAWDKADDVCIEYNGDCNSGTMYEHADNARDFATQAKEYAERAQELLDGIHDDLDEMIENGGQIVGGHEDEDAPLVIDPATTNRYLAAERRAEVSASLSRDPLELLRGIADETGALGVAFALQVFAVFAYVAIAYGAVRTMGVWAIVPLAVLTFGIFWVPRGRALVGGSQISGYHARAHETSPYQVAEMIARDLADIEEVGGGLYLFTAEGWRAIIGLTLGAQHAFTAPLAEDEDGAEDGVTWAFEDAPAFTRATAPSSPAWDPRGALVSR